MTPEALITRFDAIEHGLADLEKRDAVARLQGRDPSLWSEEPEGQKAIADRLGWLDVVGGEQGWPKRLATFREAVAHAGLGRVVLAGMGGSSLAPEVFAKVFGGGPDGASLTVLDSTHPDAVRPALVDADLSDTLVIVSSKSGTTDETRAFAALAESRLTSTEQLAAITDPGSELAAEALDRGWREVFLNPADIGGRYSALSLFGMVPAALIGVDVEAIWERAAAFLRACGHDTAARDNPAAVLAGFMGGLARTGRDKLTVLADPELEPLGDWIEQLVAESTGKHGVGIVPVVGEPAGGADVYGADRAFVELRLGGRPVAGAAELEDAGHPLLTIDVADRHDIGAEFVRWELATALAAVLLGVNPFDEPNVAESKANTRAVLEDAVGGADLPEPEHGDVRELINAVRPGDYFSIQCYLPTSSDGEAALRRLRLAVRAATRAATTAGWGPRFLHSTGQLHKGGGDNIVALQIVDAPSGGADIPGKPYDFATLVRTQALGDLRSLRQHGRRVAQVGVRDLDGLRQLVDGAVPPPS